MDKETILQIIKSEATPEADDISIDQLMTEINRWLLDFSAKYISDGYAFRVAFHKGAVSHELLQCPWVVTALVMHRKFSNLISGTIAGNHIRQLACAETMKKEQFIPKLRDIGNAGDEADFASSHNTGSGRRRESDTVGRRLIHTVSCRFLQQGQIFGIGNYERIRVRKCLLYPWKP